MNYQWQLSQQKNELAETDISQSVTRKINKFWRLVKERDECKEALKISKSDLIKAEEGSREYKKIERAIASLETTVPQLEEEIKEFDAVLTKDMDRLKRQQPINQARVARLQAAGKGIKKNGADSGSEDGTKASIPVMITNEMRTALYALGYSVADVDALRPAEAAKLLADGTVKPAAPQPTPGPGTIPEAPKPPTPPKAPGAEPTKPVKSAANPPKPEGEKKKSNALVVALGSVLAFAGGLFIGRQIK